MKMNPKKSKTLQKVMKSGRQVLVWDLPTRLFHWMLLILVITSFITGKIGGIWMQYHMLSGYAILGLLLFRLIWGFIGGRYARFSSFIHGPGQVIKHVQTLLKRDAPKYLGHNPLGGWSVSAMLVTLMVQTVSGLFANDDIFTEGPLYPFINKATSDWLTRVHNLNQELIVALILVHIMAVLFYLIAKKENLILPMFTGRKYWYEDGQSSTNQLGMAALITGLITVGIYLIVR